MSNIRKRLIAIAVICAVSISMTACSEKSEKKNGIETETLSSEEIEQLKRVEFKIEEFNGADDSDPVPVNEGAADSQSAGNNSSDNNGNGGSAEEGGSDDGNGNGNGAAGNNDNNGAGGGGNNNSSGGGNNSNSNNGGNSSGGNNSSGDNNSESGNSAVIVGTEKQQQAFWLDLSGDYKFDGEFINATFKIKDTTANGTYPILIKWLDFSNFDAKALDAFGIDGSVVVGGNAVETKFKNDGSFEVKADSVSGNPGDTVTISFRFKNNPGICASVFRFSYDSDALEYVGGEQGADFLKALETQNLE